ncbi:hypothetical protein M8818_003329 [Zalaria obscura]|uniref:Uncharacterized protein n=1 Tax=Zalaria obscura TaxID=2024903 RepID=A0ACC3SFE7_9PEZI
MSLSYMRPTAASSARAATTTTIASTASKLPQRLPGWVPSMPKPSPKGLSLTLPRPSEESLKRVDAVKARGKYQGAINGWRADFGKLLLHANLIKAVLKDWEQFAEVRPPTVDCTLIPTTSLGVRQESSSHNVLSPAGFSPACTIPRHLFSDPPLAAASWQYFFHIPAGQYDRMSIYIGGLQIDPALVVLRCIQRCGTTITAFILPIGSGIAIISFNPFLHEVSRCLHRSRTRVVPKRADLSRKTKTPRSARRGSIKTAAAPPAPSQVRTSSLARPSKDNLILAAGMLAAAVKARGKYHGAINGWRPDFSKMFPILENIVDSDDVEPFPAHPGKTASIQFYSDAFFFPSHAPTPTLSMKTYNNQITLFNVWLIASEHHSPGT